jgi:hypothetical protein
VAFATLAPALAVGYTSHLQIVIASGKTLRLAVLSPLALALGIGVGFVVMPWIGLVGASVMFLSVYVFIGIFARALARKVSTVRWTESTVLMAIAFSAVCAAAGALLPWETPTSIALRLGGSVLLLAGAFVWFLRKK